MKLLVNIKILHLQRRGVAATVDGIFSGRARGIDDHVLSLGFCPLHTHGDTHRGLSALK
ncbi:Hypothetical predicted protein, partial [Xyrichtys novacula]